ncbi:cell division protein FtsL [candidate division TA06 bacterium]|uniref:Cell division protein FtsL n=1 Tax=candidate division TA06 bacterium TaxID=2250710 RepID=A0A933IA80_UNCT6|nr:cell division protein FtsL [candidate division TA06 bacterium]
MNTFLHKTEIKLEKNRTGWLIAGWVFVFFAVMFLFIWQKFSLSQQLGSIEKDQNYNREVVSLQKELQVRLQQLEARNRLESRAMEDLGFEYPSNRQVVVMLKSPAPQRGGLAYVLAGLFRPVSSAWSKP